MDPIVAETRRLRTEYAARFGNDVKAMIRDLRAREQKSRRTYVSLPSRPASSAVPVERRRPRSKEGGPSPD